MANEIEEHLLKDEKLEIQPISELTVNSEKGFTGYITNKRVIFFKNNHMNSFFHDIPYIDIQGAASIQHNKNNIWLVFGVILSLIGLVLILKSSIVFITIVFGGIISIVIWYFTPHEALNLNGIETHFIIEADKNVLYKMLKDIRNNQKI